MTCFYTHNVPKLPCTGIVYMGAYLLEFEASSWDTVINAYVGEVNFSPG